MRGDWSAKACRKSHQNRTAERFETAKVIQLCTRYGLRSGLPDLIAFRRKSFGSNDLGAAGVKFP